MTTDDNALTKLGVWDRYTIYIAKSFTLIKYMFNSHAAYFIYKKVSNMYFALKVPIVR